MTFNLFQDKKLKYFDHTHTSQSNEARIRVPFAPKPRKFYTLKRRSAFPSELNILLNLEEISQLLLSETSETCMCKNMNIKLLPRIINPEKEKIKIKNGTTDFLFSQEKKHTPSHSERIRQSHMAATDRLLYQMYAHNKCMYTQSHTHTQKHVFVCEKKQYF